MSSFSGYENPYKVIAGKFNAAYSFGEKQEDSEERDEQIQVTVIGKGEFISGVQDNSAELGIFRPTLDVGFNVFKVFLWAAAAKGEVQPGQISEEQFSEYLIGGIETWPIGYEVISNDPFTALKLDDEAMTDLARKIDDTTFR